ncbi:MAG: AMP-binding protein, partial [Syntrophobacteraceae bacterium]|nr:AMP-binding protein [Syntrophobacteraceae bacterium]
MKVNTRKYPNKPVLKDQGRSFTWRQTNERVNRLADSLLSLGVKKGDKVTAGNACALCDAASAAVLMERGKALAMGLKPVALLRGYAFVGVEPKKFGISPAKAIPIALKKAGLTLADIDLLELNEAFAAQYIACEQDLGLDRSKVNVYGGAIALG